MKNGNFTTLNTPSDLLSNADGDFALAPMQVSLAPEAVISLASIGRPNRSFMLQEADMVQLAPTALQQAITSTKAVIPPPTRKAPLPSDSGTTGAKESGSDDDEAFTEEEGSDDSDGKILGMPKGIAIGVGVAIVAIGGFLIYKKVKGK